MSGPRLVLLASPRGWCAGVERAVDIVDRALALYGAPLYVRHEIIHNRHVVEDFRRRGVVFVEDEAQAPPGARIIFSAHGVSPQVYASAAARGLRAIDATCPLVTKVHVEVRRFAADGYSVVLIAHRDHPEAIGIVGEAPDTVVVVETVEDVATLEVADPQRVAWVCQTTLSVDDTAVIVEALRSRFPAIVGPRTDDICFATTNRQRAVTALAERADLVLVVGSANSSNSNRLVEVSRAAGVPAHLIDSAAALREEWIADAEVVGVSSGASAPEPLVAEVVAALCERGAEVEEVRVAEERVRFMLPRELRAL
jgi:4-hydroxy-3-methylbut-2-enyl diphosphate reductase